jgi:hypothetical protein
LEKSEGRCGQTPGKKHGGIMKKSVLNNSGLKMEEKFVRANLCLVALFLFTMSGSFLAQPTKSAPSESGGYGCIHAELPELADLLYHTIYDGVFVVDVREK